MSSRRWQLPLALATIGLLIVVVVWSGLGTKDEAGSTPTPTKTPALAALPGLTGSELTALPVATLTPTRVSGEPLLAIPTFTSSPSPFPTWTPTLIPAGATLPTPTRVVPSATPALWTATPIPTFTPPPPLASMAREWDHFWLARPIPAEYVNWTDRIYPYGSTRGRTLATHHGVEFFNPVGVPVLAAGAGTVVTAGSDDQVLFGPQANFYGNLVVIRHDLLYQEQNLYSLYGHLSEVMVGEGQQVAAGDLIGHVGGTGVANGGAHLHFEVRVGENRYEMTRNPELWLEPFRGRGVIAGRLVWPDGGYVYEAPLLIRRADDPGLFVNRTVYTYADDSVNPDDEWRENFTSPDLEPGPYAVIFRDAEHDLTRQELVWVYSGETSFVTIQLGVRP